jgi:hypothetical protein
MKKLFNFLASSLILANCSTLEFKLSPEEKSFRKDIGYSNLDSQDKFYADNFYKGISALSSENREAYKNLFNHWISIDEQSLRESDIEKLKTIKPSFDSPSQLNQDEDQILYGLRPIIGYNNLSERDYLLIYFVVETILDIQTSVRYH